MVSGKRLDRDLYRLCNVSCFVETHSIANGMARLKIGLGFDYESYNAIPLHKRITMRGSQYVRELDGKWTRFERHYLLRFMIDSHKSRLHRLRMINKDF